MNDTIPVTAQFVEQRLEHRVTDAAVAASRHSHRYQALCGQLFIAAPTGRATRPAMPGLRGSAGDRVARSDAHGPPAMAPTWWLVAAVAPPELRATARSSLRNQA